MIDIQLTNNKGFKWHKSDNCYAKGSINDKGQPIEGKQLAEYFSTIDSPEKLQEKLAQANGHFAVVITINDTLFACVDRFRTIPLFYVSNATSTTIADSTIPLEPFVSDSKLDPARVSEFILTSGTFADTTLFKEIKQVPAGEFATLSEGSGVTRTVYHTFVLEDFYETPKEALLEKFSDISANVFERMLGSIGQRTVVIPLSGGLDSRFIAAMVKKMGYSNVLCYTYGKQESFEVAISKKVAEQLGFAYHFIEYDEHIFEQYFGAAYQGYEQYAGNYSTLPFEQDHFAVHTLKKQELIPQDSIFMPGFYGDISSGSWMLKKHQLSQVDYSQKGVAQYIVSNGKFCAQQKDTSMYAGLEETIMKGLPDEPINGEKEFNSLFQNWGIKHRLGKYMINSMRSYEYLGYEWRLPLCDNEFIDFWRYMPFQYKYDKGFYKDFLSEKLFSPLGINFTHTTFDNYFTHSGLFTYLREHAPKGVRKLLRQFLIKDKEIDVNGLNTLYEMIYKRLDKDNIKKDQDLNFIEGLWYIENLKKRIGSR